jgi:ABC-type Fe3+/spermidine/putrescine transport system ATPase subunit
MNIVQLDSVSKSYQHEKVLHHFSLQIEAGERVVLLGASGCGKTTLLRLIAGLETPDEGEIFISGKPAARSGKLLLPPEQRHLGMVFQDLALWPHLSVQGNIEFALKTNGLPKLQRQERVQEMLQLVDLLGYENRRPHQLSGGQQQRVALARALAPNPQLLLMDEPLSSLDPTLNQHLRKEIIRLQEATRVALLYVTHAPDEAQEIATRIINL